MGRELHIGAAVLMGVAMCGRVAMKNGDVVVKNADVLATAGRNADVLRHGDALRHLDEVGALRHLDEGRHVDVAEILQDVALDGAQLTAELLLEWQDEAGEVDEDDLSGVWVRNEQLEDGLEIVRRCKRTLEDGWRLSCLERAERGSIREHVVEFEASQVVGDNALCTHFGRLQVLYGPPGTDRQVAERLVREQGCHPRVDGELGIELAGRELVEERG